VSVSSGADSTYRRRSVRLSCQHVNP
jgi:hypothetical protein